MVFIKELYHCGVDKSHIQWWSLHVLREQLKLSIKTVFLNRGNDDFWVLIFFRSQCTKSEQLLITLISGYIAGVFCAVVSHPADTVVSVLNKQKGSTAIQVIKSMGFKSLFDFDFLTFFRCLGWTWYQNTYDWNTHFSSMVYLWLCQSYAWNPQATSSRYAREFEA